MQQACAQCSAGFEIEDRDLEFYDKASPVIGGKKLNLAPPRLCPKCRRQRRLSWRNERTFYRRPCDLCKKEVVSIHAPDHPYPVYCNPCYWSDKWSPLSFGKPFDTSRSFLEQFYELYSLVPQRAMVNENGITSENCEYTIDVPFSQNCYMCSGMWKAQNCYYCRICDQSKFCVDCEGVKLGSELVHDSVDSQRLYHCRSMQNSESCNDCIFGFDMKGCSDCIACFGLRQKRHHIFNKPHTEVEYKNALASLALNTHSGAESLKKQFAAFIQQFPRKNMNLQNCEDSVGDHLFHCRDVIGYVTTSSEHSRWVERSDGPIWSYDQTQSGNPQWCLECVTVDNGYNNITALYSNQSRNVYYSENCFSCQSLFGCISLRRHKHCILNTEYSEKDYEHVVSSVVERMQADGEFGEFFSIERSPFAYNETNAAEFFPLSKEEVLSKGWKWQDDLPFTTGKETLRWNEVPEAISDVPDSVVDEVLSCETCNKNFKVVSQELEFYRDMGIPLPHTCPDCRNLERLSRRNPQTLFDRSCAKCQKPIQTTYTPDSPEIVYCETCYLAEVY